MISDKDVCQHWAKRRAHRYTIHLLQHSVTKTEFNPFRSYDH